MEQSTYVPTRQTPISKETTAQPQAAEQHKSFRPTQEQLPMSNLTEDNQRVTTGHYKVQTDPYQIITDLTMKLNHLQLQ